MTDAQRVKQLEKAEGELQRRRDRGKVAQREFRKRQAKATQVMRDEHRRLKAAVEDLVKVARSDDRAELRAAIRIAAKAAGCDARTLEGKEACDEIEEERDDEMSITVTTPSSSLTDASSNMGPTSRSPSKHESTLAAALAATPDASEVESPTHRYNQNTNHAERSPTPGRMSPRLDYGLWLDPGRYIRIVNPPLDIVPYIGAGRHTFSGHVFWACGEYLLALCHQAQPHNSPLYLRQQHYPQPILVKEANMRLRRLVQHSPPLHDVRYIKAMAEARLEFRERGYIEGDNPAGEEDSAEMLQRRVEADYAERGEDVAVWLSLMEVERHVRKQLGSQAFQRLERALSPRSAKPDEDESGFLADHVGQLARLLVQKLAETYICFGDGPRWRADSVSALFGGEMQDAC